MGQALARRIGFDRFSVPAARRIGSAGIPPARAQELGAPRDSGAESGCGPGQPSAGCAPADAQPAAAGLRERRRGQARLASVAPPCTREGAGGGRGDSEAGLIDPDGVVTRADAARLPPCVLMSSYSDATVPWCVAKSWLIIALLLHTARRDASGPGLSAQQHGEVVTRRKRAIAICLRCLNYSGLAVAGRHSC